MALYKRAYAYLGDNIALIGDHFSNEMLNTNELAVAGHESYPPAQPQGHYYDEQQFQEKYDTIIAQAKKEAQQNAEIMIQEAQRSIEEARKKAQEEGYQAGKESGYQKIAEHIKEALKVIEQAKEQRNEVIRANEPETLKLALKVAREIIKKEISLDSSIVMKILEGAIEKISDNEQVVIKVSHSDLQEVRNNKDRIIDLVEAKNLSIVGDKHVEEGGCMIETKLGYIDARLDTKLEIMEEAMLAVYEEDKAKEKTLAKEKQARALANGAGEDLIVTEEENIAIDNTAEGVDDFSDNIEADFKLDEDFNFDDDLEKKD